MESSNEGTLRAFANHGRAEPAQASSNASLHITVSTVTRQHSESAGPADTRPTSAGIAIDVIRVRLCTVQGSVKGLWRAQCTLSAQ